MATNRTRRTRRTRQTELAPTMLAWLKDEAPAPVDHYFMTDDDVRALWAAHGAAIVEEWAERAPGTRPSFWWQFDAPEHRQQLGGTGTATASCFVLGIPADWTEDFDPALYESQAAFLKRHGLLLAGEGRRGVNLDSSNVT